MKVKGAGTPALLCFKPEEQPTGCRTTPYSVKVVKPLFKLFPLYKLNQGDEDFKLAEGDLAVRLEKRG